MAAAFRVWTAIALASAMLEGPPRSRGFSSRMESR
jgi:hypothetical protein